ncbi:hypothetical protein QJS10_CPA09g00448 [Acorus calamus]|uniref:Uncharacterized protein n=1 Tax=Acorus calamus TaxID=4465 RepID=A0AAV9E4C6_ACOCL|nr:hypothetical protein QJS10_CPA09g00448 [Acorus calamus]
MSDAMKQGPPSSKQVFKGPPSTQQTSKGSFNILQADKGDYNDANKFSILNECSNTNELVMANIESSECPFNSNEETTALPNFGEQAQIRLIPSDPISENSEIHYEGNTIIGLSSSQAIKGPADSVPIISDSRADILKDNHSTAASIQGGAKNSQPIQSRNKRGAGPKKGKQHKSDMIKDFFKDLTEGHSSPDNSKIVSSSKGPSAKGTKRN